VGKEKEGGTVYLLKRKIEKRGDSGGKRVENLMWSLLGKRGKRKDNTQNPLAKKGKGKGK